MGEVEEKSVTGPSTWTIKEIVDDLRPYALKPFGSLRICVSEVRKIVQGFDTLQAKLVEKDAEIEVLKAELAITHKARAEAMSEWTMAEDELNMLRPRLKAALALSKKDDGLG